MIYESVAESSHQCQHNADVNILANGRAAFIWNPLLIVAKMIEPTWYHIRNKKATTIF